ncbi:TRAP transporter substrate-binding protein [Xanthobacteraceae bacterium Astr-EGSB]|uniref:TRAP transporter substrate-binding protein n=1 Tax=Astrobacterium formosum TaxID=3069710 RepID=UPI0027AE45D9|nr:TRAP transporter substrate-binding protein [Xanthobacteraceae bacterium Astr-EGSB]
MKMQSSLLTTLTIAGAFAFAVGTTQAQTVYRFASESPRSDTQSIAAERMAEVLKQKSGGKLDLKIFADSQLGTFQAAIAGVRGGTIDMAVSGSGNFTGLVPLIGILDLPYLFAGTDHAYKVLDGPVGQSLLAKLEPLGMKGLAFWDNGWRQMTNSKHPIKTPADVKGLKMRTTGSPAHIEAFKELGANPVPMPIAELYTALEMKTVDAQEHPIGVFYSSKFFEVQKHVSLTYHAYSALILVMNKAKFDGLSPELQKVVLEAAHEGAQYQRKLNNENIAKIAADLKSKGIAVVEKVDNGPFTEATKNVKSAFVAKFGGADVIKAIDAQR